MKNTLILILLVLFTFPLFPQETLPPYHWANSYIDYLKVRGYMPELSIIDRPFNRRQIAVQLLHLDWKVLEKYPNDKEMIETLYREFAPEIQYAAGSLEEIENPDLRELLQRIIHAFNAESDAPHFKVGAFGTGSVDYSNVSKEFDGDIDLHPHAGIYWGDRLTLYHNSKIFRKAAPGYVGKKFRNLYAYVEQAYFAYNWDWGEIKIGRDFMQIGPGRSGQLLISDNSRTFDMYRVAVGKGLLQFSFWGILLDRRRITDPTVKVYSNASNRYLNGHRLTLNIHNRIYVGISEVVVYGGPNGNWELGVMNPLMIYYAYDINTPSFAANSFYNLDWDLYLFPNMEIYGEFLIDDFQVDKKTPQDLEPNELGLIAGFQWTNPLNLAGSMFHAEYVQVRNRTYNAPVNDWEKYLHRNQVIGYYLGNNFERYGIAVSYWARSNLRAKLFANLIRQGQGSVQGEFNKDFLNYTVAEGYHEPFPWGVVETWVQPGLEIFFKPHQLAYVSLDVAYNDYRNYLNQSGKNQSELTANLTLWLQWDYFRKIRSEK